MLLQRPGWGIAVCGSCSVVVLRWWAGVCCVCRYKRQGRKAKNRRIVVCEEKCFSLLFVELGRCNHGWWSGSEDTRKGPRVMYPSDLTAHFVDTQLRREAVVKLWRVGSHSAGAV